MTAAWPSTLVTKSFNVSGYQEGQLNDNVISTSMDSGPPKRRRRFTAVPLHFTGSLNTLSSTEVDYLLDFYDNTLQSGVLPFTWVHPRTKASGTFQFQKRPEISPADGSPIIYSASMDIIQLPT